MLFSWIRCTNHNLNVYYIITVFLTFTAIKVTYPKKKKKLKLEFRSLVEGRRKKRIQSLVKCWEEISD